MVCKKCNANLPVGSRFCNHCGTAVEYTYPSLDHKVEEKRKKKSNAPIFIGIFAFIALVVGVKVVFFIFGMILYTSDFGETEDVEIKAKTEIITEAMGKRITGPDGDFSIVVPKGWRNDDELNDTAELGYSRRIKENYLMVMKESKEDFVDDMTIQDIYTFSIETSELENLEVLNYNEATIDGRTAITFEMLGEIDLVKVHFLCGVIEGDDTYYRIYTWTLKSYFDRYDDDFFEIIQSFELMEPVVNQESTKGVNELDFDNVVIADDSSISVNLTDEWTIDEEKGDDHILSVESQNAYFGVIPEEKRDLIDDFTLDSYAELIIEEYLDIEVEKVSEPIPRYYGGNPAQQYFIEAKDGKVLFTGYLTFVETEDRYYQFIYFVTGRSIKEHKAEYEQIMKSIRFLGSV